MAAAAQSKQQQGPSPEELARQAMEASHGVAQQAAGAHSDALAKMHSQIMGQSAPSDREQHLLGLLSQLGAGGAGPEGAPGSPAGPGDPQAQQQAVWDAFPSTDPEQAQQMMGAADDPQHGILALMQQADSDRQKFEGMQADILNQIVQMLGAPAGEPAGGPPVASPGVGGEASIGY